MAVYKRHECWLRKIKIVNDISKCYEKKVESRKYAGFINETGIQVNPYVIKKLICLVAESMVC